MYQPSYKAIQIAAQVILQLCLNAGIGYHTIVLNNTNSDITTGLKWAALYQILTVTTSFTGKLAIIAFLLQIRGLQEHRPWFFWTLAVLLILINLADIGTMLGQCKPVRKWWDLQTPGTCQPGQKYNDSYSFFQGSMLYPCFLDTMLYRLANVIIQSSTPWLTHFWLHIQSFFCGSCK